MTNYNNSIGLTEGESQILEALEDAWNGAIKEMKMDRMYDDLNEFRSSINAVKRIILARPTYRLMEKNN